MESLFVQRGIVVIVRGTQVVGLSVAQRAADASDEHGVVFPRDEPFALFRTLVRIEPAKLLRMDEIHVRCEKWLDGRILLAHHVFCAPHGCIDFLHDAFQELQVALFRRDDTFPVPLVHVERMQVAQRLVGADGVHVRVDAVAGTDVIVGQGHPFPFGE